jgi:hypothetical protein
MVKHFRVFGMLRTRLEESGVHVSAVLRRAGLAQDLFDQTCILVSTKELFALWNAIGAVSNDPAIGLKLATETKTERFHPMGIAALSTASFGAAVEHMARYKRLSAPEEIIHEMDAEEWSIQFRWTLAVDVEPQVLIETCFAWMLTIARHGSGTRLSPIRVELVQPRSHLKHSNGTSAACSAASRAMPWCSVRPMLLVRLLRATRSCWTCLLLSSKKGSNSTVARTTLRIVFAVRSIGG